jgi:hypothetical protein
MERLKAGITLLSSSSPAWFIRIPPPNAMFSQLYPAVGGFSSGLFEFRAHNPELSIEKLFDLTFQNEL